MDHQIICLIIVVMQAWLVLSENEVGLEADHVVQEAAELIDFTANDDVRS